MIPISTERRLVVLGYLSSLGAGMSYGTSSLIARRIVGQYAPPMVGTAFSMLFGTAIMAVLFYRHAIEDLSVAPKRAWASVAAAGCASAWGVSFLFLALDKAPVVQVAPLAGTNPLVSILLVHVFLKALEQVTWRSVAGALLVVGGVALIALGG